MLIANAPCSWGIAYPTGNAVTWQQYLDEVAAAGYRGTELGPFGFLPKDPAVLQGELNRRDLVMIGATHVQTFGDTASGPVLMQTKVLGAAPAELRPFLERSYFGESGVDVYADDPGLVRVDETAVG